MGKRFFYDITSTYTLYNAIVWHLNSFFNISFNCKYAAGNCMFGVGNGGARAIHGVCSWLVVMCICVYVCIYVFMCVCVYIYMCGQVSGWVCVYVCVCVYMYICTVYI